MTIRILRTCITLGLLPLVGATVLPPRPLQAVHGDYVEARTASVFAGACHYNGERVTEGKSAITAWDIAGGSFQGIDLSGTKIIAAVGCEDNLAEPSSARRSELIVDAPTDASATAAVAWVRTRCADQLGTVAGLHRQKVLFQRNDEQFNVSADGFAAMAVQPMPNHECCTQPNLVWYQPLMPLDHRRVGYTENAEYDAGRVCDTWQRSDENSAFYGTFSR